MHTSLSCIGTLCIYVCTYCTMRIYDTNICICRVLQYRKPPEESLLLPLAAIKARTTDTWTDDHDKHSSGNNRCCVVFLAITHLCVCVCVCVCVCARVVVCLRVCCVLAGRSMCARRGWLRCWCSRVAASFLLTHSGAEQASILSSTFLLGICGNRNAGIKLRRL